MQHKGKVSERTQSSVVGVCFGFTKKCSDIPGRLVKDPDFRSRRCLVTHGQLMEDLLLISNLVMKNLMYLTIAYLDDCICPGGGCELATIKRFRSAWGKFRELLPVLTCKAISLNTRGQMYQLYQRDDGLFIRMLGPQTRR